MEDWKLEKTQEVFLHGEGRQAGFLAAAGCCASLTAGMQKGLDDFFTEAIVCHHVHAGQPVMPAAPARRTVTFPSTPS